MADLSKLTTDDIAREIGAARLRELALEAELAELRPALPAEGPSADGAPPSAAGAPGGD